MAANILDAFNESTTNDRPNAATLTAVKANGASTLTVDSTTGWATATAVHFTMYEVDAEGVKDATTQRDYKGIVNSSTTINNVTIKGGADREFPIGAKVICAPTAGWADDLVQGLNNEHNQLDGSHSDITADSVTINAGGSVDFSEAPLATADLADASVTPDKLGLSPSTADVATSQTTTSTSYTDLATAGPAATVTIGDNGLALVVIRCRMASNTDNALTYMGVAMSGANTESASDTYAAQRRISDANSAGFETIEATFLRTGLTAGSTTFTSKYKVNTGTGTFDIRSIIVIPL